MKKTPTYVAPCVAPKKSIFISSLIVFGGLVLILGGLGKMELGGEWSFFGGMPAVIGGLFLLFLAGDRLSRR